MQQPTTSSEGDNFRKKPTKSSWKKCSCTHVEHGHAQNMDGTHLQSI